MSESETNQSTLSRQLVQLIRRKPISDQELARAAQFTLDAVANALAGRSTHQGRLLLEWGAAQGQDAGRTAFVGGGLTHILETDDLHRLSVTHPGCVVVPAVLAVAERERSSGIELLHAVLHGYEAMCRVGNAVGSEHYRIWHNTATCGPYGSAMAAASLLDLDDQQATDTLGNAGTQSSGVWQFLESGAMSKHLHAGRAAESGIVAADLAALGFTGPPAILEGKKGFFAATCPNAEPAAVIADADAWQLTTTSIKPWPCCRHTHPVIEAALSLHKTVAATSIDTITIETYPAALDVCNRPQPMSEYEAKFSLFHCVAAALTDGQVDFDSFDAVARDRLRALCSRVSVVAADPWRSAYPLAWGAKVSVTTLDGTLTSVERTVAKGDPEAALDDDEMVAKASMLFGYAGCSDDDAARIVADILALTQSDTPPAVVSEICRLFRTVWQ